MKKTMTIKDLPETERPYERCLKDGPSVLSDRELLAVILRSGRAGSSSLDLADEILNFTKETSYPGLLGLLHLSFQDLMGIKGIGKVKAVQLKCIGELSRRMARTAAKPQLSFHHPMTIARYYMEQLRHEEQEVLICMMLDGANHLIGEKILSRGTVNAALITPREVFLEALKYHAVNLILIHNHPGGNPAPSSHDLDATERIAQAGELLGITLLDHIVIGDQKYVSFREQNLIKSQS